MTQTATGLPVYRVFGLRLESGFPFTCRLMTAAGPPDLSFACPADPPTSWDPLRTVPLYPPPGEGSAGEGRVSLDRFGACDRLRFAGIAEFYVEEEKISCRPVGAAGLAECEMLLLGPVLAYWLERNGLPALHASAVAAGQGTCGFLGFNRQGKSTLAAALLADGLPLLTDDVLAVEPGTTGFLGRPAYPQMRLWPGEAARFRGSHEGLEPVHPDFTKLRVPVEAGDFCGRGLPFACLYLPERRPAGESGPVEIRPLSPREALLELVRHSFLGRLNEAAGWQGRRLRLLARLAGEVPLRRLVYPSGHQHLPRVRDAVLADADARCGSLRGRREAALPEPPQ